MTREFHALPLFVFIEEALDHIERHGGTAARLWRGPDGLVRGRYAIWVAAYEYVDLRPRRETLRLGTVG